MSAEEWRTVPGYPDYMVSSAGRVMSTFRGRPLIRRCSKNRGGYWIVGLRRGGKLKTFTVHGLVTAAFLGPRPADMETRHLDGNKDNNALDNLLYGTKSENAQDKLRHGTNHHATKTHCLRQHPFDDINTRFTSRGARQCRECQRIRRAAWVTNRRAA